MLSSSIDDVGARAKQIAQKTWEVVEWPVADFAAVVGWDVAALTGLLFGIKVLWLGLHHERKARGPIFRR